MFAGHNPVVPNADQRRVIDRPRAVDPVGRGSCRAVINREVWAWPEPRPPAHRVAHRWGPSLRAGRKCGDTLLSCQIKPASSSSPPRRARSDAPYLLQTAPAFSPCVRRLSCCERGLSCCVAPLPRCGAPLRDTASKNCPSMGHRRCCASPLRPCAAPNSLGPDRRNTGLSRRNTEVTRLNPEVRCRNIRLHLRHTGPALLCPEVRPLNIEVGLRNRGLTRCCGKFAFYSERE